MRCVKVSITMDKRLLARLDRWVSEGHYPNRSRAIQAAVRERLEWSRRRRLVREAAKLNPGEEKALAEEGRSMPVSRW